MGSLSTHFSTFLFLLPIGFHRLHSSFSLFLKDPSQYTSKPWFFFHPNWKNLDFYTLLLALPIASLSDLFIFLSFSGHPTYRFSFLLHSLVIFLFWVLFILIICKESFNLFAINESFLFFLGGVCFFVEYFVDGGVFFGVSFVVYELLDYLTLVCAFSCLFLSIKPTCFLADFFLSSGVVFKATWVLQGGMSLYSDVFGFSGCRRVSLLSDQEAKVDVKCDLEEDSLRGIALVNLLFVVHAIVVFVTCFGLFGLLSRNQGLRCSEDSGPLLSRIESQGMLMEHLPDLEME